jgi:hypothetical protein
MRNAGRWILCVTSLAVVLALANQPMQAQTEDGAPLKIRQTAYLKSSNPHAGDHFGDGGNLPSHSGNSIAISDDGNYLAVGAHMESSAAKGINGNQNDTSMYGVGAVYVFARRGGKWVQQAYVKPSNSQMGENF